MTVLSNVACIESAVHNCIVSYVIRVYSVIIRSVRLAHIYANILIYSVAICRFFLPHKGDTLHLWGVTY